MDLSGDTNNSSELTHSQFPVASSFRDWAELLPDLLDLIVTKLHQFPDYLRFCGVCPKWRSVALKTSNIYHKQSLDLLKASHNKLPMLIIKTEENNDDMTGLYSVSDGKTYNLKLPFPYRNRFIGSSHGWLLCVEDYDIITLLNPLTNKCIPLPRFEDHMYEKWKIKGLEYFLVKGILTASPDVSPNNYAVAVIYHCLCKLVIYKSGDLHWKCIDLPEWGYTLGDVVCYKNDIYGVTVDSRLVQIDIDSGIPKYIIHESQPLPVWNYLVESQGELLFVQRFWEEIFEEDNDDKENNNKENETENDSNSANEVEEEEEDMEGGDYFPRTTDFKIFKLAYEKECGKWVEIDNIGEQALFVGSNHSVSISTLEFPSLRSNSIYFTNHYYLWIPPYKCFRPDEDSGFYSFDDKSWHSHHLLDLCQLYLKPPIWFVPNSA